MRRRTYALVTAVALAAAPAAVALFPHAALADGTPGAGGNDADVVLPTMSWVTSGVRLDAGPGRAYVTGRYRCAEQGADTTMWLSARQAPGVGSADLAPESLALYDAEIKDFAADAGFAPLCDKRWHPGRLVVEHRLGGDLQQGPALVEWCVHDRDEKPVNSPGFTAGCTMVSVPAR